MSDYPKSSLAAVSYRTLATHDQAHADTQMVNNNITIET